LSPSDILAIWESLAREPRGSSDLIRRRIAPDAAVDLFACHVPSRNVPSLLIQANAAPRSGELYLPACRGIHIAHEISGEGEAIRTSISILLEDNGKRDIFAILCADLIDVMVQARDLLTALDACVARLAAWHALFERLRREGLSAERQRGLFGEMHVLKDLILPALHPVEAVRSWLGWDYSHQDFKSGGNAIEVKTTIAKRHVKILISNEKQLDDRPYDMLVLAHVRIDESDFKGLSLPDLIAEIRKALSAQPLARQELDDNLFQAGYLENQADLYARPCYSVNDVKIFHVHENFPRLTEANLPTGVGDIHYSIVLSDLGAFEIDRTSLEERLRQS
jgi:hypothetical protein